jgi:hypothetical protein
LHIPLFRPTFFALEAARFLDALRQSTSLVLLDPQEEEAGGGKSNGWTNDEVVKSWVRTNRRAYAQLKKPLALFQWSPEESQRFFGYARRRRELESQFGAAGIEVPRLHPALHEGEVKTLCLWRWETPTVLPRADLLLVEQPRERRGFFGKRTVLDQGLVPMDRVWDILGPFAEIRDEPAPLLIFRQAKPLPAQVRSALESLAKEPGDKARRTELAGVVDFDLEAG